MTPSRSLTLAVASAALVACSHPGDSRGDGWWFAELARPTPNSARADSGIVFQPVATYGDDEGIGALGRIAAVAASPDLVLVADQAACAIVVFERGTGRALRRSGRCGRGPGDYQDIRSLQIVGDSVLIVDQDGRMARLAAFDGGEGRRVALDQLGVTAGFGVAWLTLLDSSLAVVNRNLLYSELPDPEPDASGERTRPYVLVSSLSPGERTRELIRDGPAVAAHVRSMLLASTACVVPGAQPEDAYVVALNNFVPQVIAIAVARDEEPVINTTLGRIPMEPLHWPVAGETKILPSYGYRDAACGDSVAVLAWRTWSTVTPTRRTDAPTDVYAIVVWPHQRRVRWTLLGGSDPSFPGRLAGAAGKHVFFASSSRFLHPVVMEASLEYRE